jgi:hypothetical protein
MMKYRIANVIHINMLKILSSLFLGRKFDFRRAIALRSGWEGSECPCKKKQGRVIDEILNGDGEIQTIAVIP